MQWVYLCLATIFEIAGTAISKSEQWERALSTSGGVALYILSGIFFIAAIRRIELSIAFALCSALATLGVAAVGIFWFREPADTLKMTSLALIVVGIFLLNISK